MKAQILDLLRWFIVLVISVIGYPGLAAISMLLLFINQWLNYRATKTKNKEGNDNRK